VLEPLLAMSASTAPGDPAARDLLEKLFAGVDPVSQEAVLYVLGDGLSLDEASGIMGLSAAALRKRIAGFRSLADKRLGRLSKENRR